MTSNIEDNVSNIARNYDNESNTYTFQRPAVIDMTDMTDNSIDTEKSDNSNKGSASNILFSKLTSSVWAEGKERAETVFKSYASVDYLRPYFNVEPKVVLHRLLSAFIPVNVKDNDCPVPSELYGPVMICLTLIALLLFEMKSTGTKVQEGTLMGTAILTCFGYWIGASAIMWVLAYIGNTKLRPVQINTVMGYGLTGHCIVVLLGSLIHFGNSHVPFYVIWGICGGLCSARVVTIFWARTPGHSERIISAVTIVVLHMGFLLYLHFAYHLIVSEVANAIKNM